MSQRTASSKTPRKTHGYLEFYKYQFHLHNNDPKNQYSKLSVPKAGQKFGAEWQALSSEQQQLWHNKAKVKNHATAKHARKKRKLHSQAT